jgi:hypothetical protein
VSPVPGGREPSGPRRWWGQLTGGARVAVGLGAAAVVVVLVLGLGAVAWGIGRYVGHGDGRGVGGREWSSQQERPGMGDMGWGRGQEGPNGRGNGLGNNGKGKGSGNGNNGKGSNGNGNGPGRNGLAGGGGAGGMGALLGRGGVLLHGEFTTDLTGTPTVMVVQSGQVTAYTQGASLAVKSSDGYEATYTLDASTVLSSTSVSTGSSVTVLAAKDGMKAIRVMVE